METFGRFLFAFGVLLAFLGLLFWVGGRYLGFLGKLPGDIYYRKENFVFFFPLTTSLLLSLLFSILLTLLAWLFLRRTP